MSGFSTLTVAEAYCMPPSTACEHGVVKSIILIYDVAPDVPYGAVVTSVG